MNDLELLGVDDPTQSRSDPHWARRDAAAIASGVLGVVLWPAHPILGGIAGASLGRNGYRFITKQRTLQEAVENVGAVAVATAGALALPTYPAIGFVAGLVGSKFLFNGDSLKGDAKDVKESIVGLLGAGSVPTLDDVRNGRGVLKQGMKGDAVVYVQGVVGAIADGDFGPKTVAAVKEFQKRYALTADGIVGKETMSTIDKLAGGPGSAMLIDFTSPDDAAKAAAAEAAAKALVAPSSSASVAPSRSALPAYYPQPTMIKPIEPPRASESPTLKLAPWKVALGVGGVAAALAGLAALILPKRTA